MSVLSELLAKGSASDGRGVLTGDGVWHGWPEVWDSVTRTTDALAARAPGPVAVVHDGTLDALVAEVSALLCGRDVLPVVAWDRASPRVVGTGPVVRLVGVPAGTAAPTAPGVDVVDPPDPPSTGRGGPRHRDPAVPEGRLLPADAGDAGTAAAELARAAGRLANATGITAADVVSSPLPPHAGLGLLCVLLAWSGGASLVLADPAATAGDPLAWFRSCARHRVTVGAVSPQVLRTAAPAIKDTAEELDLSSIRVLVVGSEPVPVTADELRTFNDAAMERSFDEVALCPSYATAGGVLVWSMTPPDRLWRSHLVSAAELAAGRWQTLLTDGGRELVSCGPVLPGAAVRTRAEAPDAVGDLLVREVDPDGVWRATGDEGHVAEDVFVTRRARTDGPVSAAAEDPRS